MKKVLFVATIASHIKAFHLPYLKLFKDNGFKTYVAANWNLDGEKRLDFVDEFIDLPIQRSPYSMKNLTAIKLLKKIIDKEKFDLIHCHTPMGSVVTRLAAKHSRKNGTRVIYTAHGFHFYKGAPTLNWMLFYPVEWYLAKYTDTLITINHEDEKLAKKKFAKRCKDIQYISGVGIETQRFNLSISEKEKIKLKGSLGLEKDDFILTCVARLDKNKNQGFLLECMKELINGHSNIHLLLAGRDELNGEYQKLSEKLNLENKVHFLGNRDDVPQLLNISDVVVSASKREGLPVNVIEAIAAGKPVVAIKCRGIEDIIKSGVNGFIVDNKDDFIDKINLIFLNEFSPKNDDNFVDKFSVLRITESMKKIYNLWWKYKWFYINLIIKIVELLNKLIIWGEKLMKKVLFVASVTRHINTFHIPYLKYFKDNGYEVHVASKGEENIKYCDKHFNVDFERSPFKKNNLKAYKELKKIIKEGDYSIIHCHTPVASALTRLAAKKARKNGTKVFCTAHGFHFYKGAPTKNWVIFYPVEKYLSKYTDTLITINEEDYEFAKKKLNAKRIAHTHGVGVDPNRFSFDMSDGDRNLIRSKFNIGELDFLMMYTAELNDNKNQQMLIDAMKILVKKYPNIKLLLVGDGVLKEKFEKEIEENFLQNNILLLGYRTDIPELLKIADLYVATSKREGLPVNIIEAMISGLPLVVTNSRGQRELVEDGKNGYVVEIGDVDTLVKRIISIYSDIRIREQVVSNAKDGVNKYLIDNVMKEMKEIYDI